MLDALTSNYEDALRRYVDYLETTGANSRKAKELAPLRRKVKACKEALDFYGSGKIVEVRGYYLEELTSKIQAKTKFKLFLSDIKDREIDTMIKKEIPTVLNYTYKIYFAKKLIKG